MAGLGLSRELGITLKLLYDSKDAELKAAASSKRISKMFGATTDIGRMSNQQLTQFRTNNGLNGTIFGNNNEFRKNFTQNMMTANNLMAQNSAKINRSGGGFGQYILANAVGGNAALMGLALRQSGHRGIGTGLILGGAVGRGISGAIGLAKGGAELLGLDKNTLNDYAEFDKSLKLAILNLKAGIAGDEWGKTSKEVAGHMATLNAKFKNAAMSLSSQYGGAGNATDVGNLFRAMSGVGGLKTGQEVINLSRTAMRLATVSEETSPEEAGKGIMAIYNAAQGVGIKNLGFEQIASTMYRAGALSPARVSDLTKNASNIAMYMAGGGSLSEAMSSYMLATSFGFTPARAGTQLSSLQLRKGGVWESKGYDKIFGITRDEMQNMSMVEFARRLNTQAVKEGLSTKYGISGGINPLTQKSVLNDLDLIMMKDFGLRGGQLASIMTKPEGMAKWDEFVKMLSNAGESAKIFDDAVTEAGKNVSNRMANATNAIENLKFEIWGVLSPWVGLSAEKAAIEASQARINNGNLTPSQRREEQALLDARKAALESPDALYKEQMKLYGGTMYEPFIKMGKTVSEWIDKNFKSDKIELFITRIGEFINTILGAATTLFNAFISIAEWVANNPIFGNQETAAAYRYATQRFGSKSKGQMFLGGLTDEQVKEIGTRQIKYENTGAALGMQDWLGRSMYMQSHNVTNQDMSNIGKIINDLDRYVAGLTKAVSENTDAVNNNSGVWGMLKGGIKFLTGGNTNTGKTTSVLDPLFNTPKSVNKFVNQ